MKTCKAVLALLLCAAAGASASEATYRGRLFWGHEVRSFQPCGSKRVYWVQAEEKTLQRLRSRAEKVQRERGKPYQPIYVEALGSIDTSSQREGFAKDYDGLIRLRSLTRVSNAIPRACAA